MSDDRRFRLSNTPSYNRVNVTETPYTKSRRLEIHYRCDRAWKLVISTPRKMELEELNYALKHLYHRFYPRPKFDEITRVELFVFEDSFEENVNQTHHQDSYMEDRLCGEQRIIAAATEIQAQEDLLIRCGTPDGPLHATDYDLLDNASLGKICIEYLESRLIVDFSEQKPMSDQLDAMGAQNIMKDARKRFPFLQYAVDSLFIHVSATFRLSGRQSSKDCRKWYIGLDSIFEVWKYYSGVKGRSLNAKPHAANGTLLEELVEYDLRQIVQSAIQNRRLEGTKREQDLGPALQIAIKKGHIEMFKLLLDFMVPFEESLVLFGNLLHSAIYQGNLRSVNALLNKSAASPNESWIKMSKIVMGSALIAAIKPREPSQALVETLLLAGADPSH